MQHIENDMDGLFQRAADSYHLEEPSWDWDSVERRIKSEDDKAAVVAVIKEKKKYKWLFILLPFIIAGTAILYTQIKESYYHHATAANNYNRGDKDIKNNSPLVSSMKITRQSVLPEEFTSAKPTLIKQQRNFHLSTTSVAYEEKEGLLEVENNKPIKESLNGWPIVTPEEPAVKVAIAVAENEKQKNSIAIPGSPGKKKNNEAINKPAFYAGVAGGPDLNHVKSVATPHDGFGIGIIAGLQVSKKMSIETGAFFYRKTYSSEGKYFSMDKMGASMPAGMVINNVESRVSLIEIPVKIKYNFSSTAHGAFFATAGLSAYIITNEKNNYSVNLNGNPDKMTGEYQNNNSTLPAMADFSLGYQHNLSSKIDIRVEPFLKVPLQGIGIGSLPVTSAGLHIGIIGHLK